MVYCSIASEKSSVSFRLTYKNYRWYDPNGDTTDKVVLYSLSNNVDINRPGVVKLSATQTFTNTSQTKAQPYIEYHKDDIGYGMIGDPKIKMLSGYFNTDTMCLKLSTPVGSMLCKYKKQ